jgi:hypothetical protein
MSAGTFLTVSIQSTLILFVGLASAQSTANRIVPRDWQMLDPVEDSIAGISLNKAYDLLKTRKSSRIIVAVIDNGIDLDHEDLREVIWTNEGEIPSNNLDDDHNGYIDDVHGWNFRGTQDGSVIENELASSAELYLSWRERFVDKKNSNEELREIYKRAERDYLENLNSTGLRECSVCLQCSLQFFDLNCQ